MKKIIYAFILLINISKYESIQIQENNNAIPNMIQMETHPNLNSVPSQMNNLMQEQQIKVEVLSEFKEIINAEELKMSGMDSVSNLIVKFWASTINSLNAGNDCSIQLMYAACKRLENVDGLHWRFVFELKTLETLSFNALDVAVLDDGTLDVFRNFSTRVLQDINILFDVTISPSARVDYQYLKESFLHNSPLILTVTQQNSENMDMTSQSSSSIMSNQTNLNVILNNLGNLNESVNYNDNKNIQIGSNLINDLNF